MKKNFLFRTLGKINLKNIWSSHKKRRIKIKFTYKLKFIVILLNIIKIKKKK